MPRALYPTYSNSFEPLAGTNYRCGLPSCPCPSAYSTPLSRQPRFGAMTRCAQGHGEPFQPMLPSRVGTADVVHDGVPRPGRAIFVATGAGRRYF